MILRTDIQSSFLNLFTKAMENEPLARDNKMNLFVLKVANNRFDYGALTEQLGEEMIRYAISRKKYQDLAAQNLHFKLTKIAQEKFRNADVNTGELGELLLYCFLESHLNAPKLLTKLELKTSANDYVKGADGVHLLQLDDKSFQIIFCESKLYSDLEKGIRLAFGSLKKMVNNGLNMILFEKHLIDSNLLKENVSEDKLQFLKKILVPSENDENLEVDYSFGVFLGFDIPITKEERQVSNSQFRINIVDKVKEAVNQQIPMINRYLQREHFVGYQFYFYVMPFDELAKIRTQIIKNLVS